MNPHNSFVDPLDKDIASGTYQHTGTSEKIRSVCAEVVSPPIVLGDIKLDRDASLSSAPLSAPTSLRPRHGERAYLYIIQKKW